MIGAVIVFIGGLCIGSFLNVGISRLPERKSVIKPRSHCPACKKTIKWYDNIPVLSYIFLWGRCRFCRERISFIYPLVEIITAFALLSLYNKLGFGFEFIQYGTLFCILVVVSFIDIKYHAIPVYLCILGIAAALLFSLISTLVMLKEGYFNLKLSPLVYVLKGLVFSLGFTYLFKLFGDLFISFYLSIRKKDSIEGETESLGLGDVDFMGMVGAFLGIKSALLVFFLAPFVALVYTLFAFVFKKSHLIPYLPYLSVAVYIVFFWENEILSFIL